MLRGFALSRRLLFALPLIIPTAAAAQEPPAAGLTAGFGILVDDGFAFEPVIGGGLRVPISQRVSIGPEAIYMPGPETSWNLMITGNVFYDFVPEGRVEPFVFGGIGLFHHIEQFPAFDETFRSTEAAYTFGGGARIWLNRSICLAPELRVGSEPHLRATVTVGIRL